MSNLRGYRRKVVPSANKSLPLEMTECRDCVYCLCPDPTKDLPRCRRYPVAATVKAPSLIAGSPGGSMWCVVYPACPKDKCGEYVESEEESREILLDESVN